MRGEDGEPVYYDGFAWTFNTTAAPTTYSHVETRYSILDQESIARGHLAYYLEWAGEALEEAGAAWVAKGVTVTSQLPARAAELRPLAVSSIELARDRFAGFRFVDATFAAQRAWRAAAEYRDLALDLEPGTSQVQRGTQHGSDAQLEASGCPTVDPSDPLPEPYEPGPAPRAQAVGADAVHVHAPGAAPHAHPAEVAVAARTASSDRPAGSPGGPPLAAAVLATAMIVLTLRQLARRAR